MYFMPARCTELVQAAGTLAAFLFYIGTSSCPRLGTRTCTDYRKGQEYEPIAD
ncbi:hypothetical protein [Paenibacillus solani]|uniref:hypothetical protein n=1 Tax=Paenibacillus solani TaxID=1705565 RepID=UPI003D273A79